ncbi:MAG: T9SS type A sorting domain-containing protein [Candidatus Sabulitectum sp.]|nr:T9SS type A sorting domain-containing protein [Candidatus Sabulitectum sp.]
MRYPPVILAMLVVLLITSVSQAMDPPVMMWEKWYYTSYDGAKFFDIELTSSGNLFITGSVYDYTAPLLDGYSAFLMNQNGEVLWEVHHPWYTGRGLDGAVLPDGSFVITGRSVETPSDTYALFIMKISQEGSIEWTKVYDYPDTKEEGYGITCLPDGGFAVCGKVHGTGTINAGQAWLLRTDAYGDTLWSREWGSTVANSPDWGKSVLFIDGKLCVLAHGLTESLPTYGTHLLFYDLDGNYLYGSDYPNLYWYGPGDLCEASDGGVTFVTNTLPVIWHTDQFGETLWWHNIPEPFGSGTNHEGFCIRRTMDSGFVFSGWGGETPEWDERSSTELCNTENNRTYDTQDGWLARYDSDGELLWTFQNCPGNSNHFYSVVQLPQGGYIAGGTYAGNGAYLVRYAPETGIEKTEPAPDCEMSISPNPFNSTLSVSFTLQESMEVSLTVYDLSGRLIDTVTTGFFPAGNSTANWTVQEGLSSGCYLVRLELPNRNVIKNCILLK